MCSSLSARILKNIACTLLMLAAHVVCTSSAMAQTAKPAQLPTSVTFDSVMLYADESPAHLKVFVQGDFMRSELFCTSTETPDIVEIIDHKNRKGLKINFAKKTYCNIDDPSEVKNLVESFVTMPEGDGESLGEETIDGRKTEVFRIVNVHCWRGVPKYQDVSKVWVDSETKLPIRKHAELGPSKPQDIDHADNFIWNKPVDPSLFDFKIPEGFKEWKPDPTAPAAVAALFDDSTPLNHPNNVAPGKPTK
jgi:hypothetical protein